MPGENVINATARAKPGDGHCLYHCLSDQGDSPSDRMDVSTRERMGAAVRRAVGEAMIQNTGMVLPTGQTLGDMMTEEAGSPEEYNDKYYGAGSREYGGAPEMWTYTLCINPYERLNVYALQDNARPSYGVTQQFTLQASFGNISATSERNIVLSQPPGAAPHYDILDNGQPLVLAPTLAAITLEEAEWTTAPVRRSRRLQHRPPDPPPHHGSPQRYPSGWADNDDDADNDGEADDAEGEGRQEDVGAGGTDPTAELRGDEADDAERRGRQEDEGAAGTDPTEELQGRRVIKNFDAAWYLGTVAGFSNGRYQITYDDGDTESITQTELASILLPVEGTGRRETAKWQLLRHIYDGIQEAVTNGTFAPTEDMLRTVFSFRRNTTLAVAKVRSKLRRLSLDIHPDKLVGAPGVVRHLASLLLPALTYLCDAYEAMTDPSVPTVDPPRPDDYPVYYSLEFATAAATTMDQLTPPSPEEGETPPDLDRDSTAELLGRDGPTELDPSVRVDGKLPKSLECVDAFPLHDFLCSPFNHVAFIHVSHQENWARCYHRITRAMLEAVESVGPERDRLLRTATRWYTGMPQILLRRGNIGTRLQLFLAGEYDTLIDEWARDAEKEEAKRRPSRPDTSQRRLNQCLDLVRKGHP